MNGLWGIWLQNNRPFAISNSPSRWRIVGNSVQAKAKSEAQLGDRQSQGIEPRRVGCGNSKKLVIAKGRFFCNQKWCSWLFFRVLTGDLGRFFLRNFCLRKIVLKFWKWMAYAWFDCKGTVLLQSPNPPSETAYCGQLHASEGEAWSAAWRQHSHRKEPRRGSVVAIPKN